MVKSVMEDNMRKKESREQVLAKMLSLVTKNPGIRPRELNRRLNKEHSASLRSTLIKRGLVRKVRKGFAAHYYRTKKST